MYMYVYRIEYVSYRLGPYRIRIVSAADRIVPALPNARTACACYGLVTNQLRCVGDG